MISRPSARAIAHQRLLLRDSTQRVPESDVPERVRLITAESLQRDLFSDELHAFAGLLVPQHFWVGDIHEVWDRWVTLPIWGVLSAVELAGEIERADAQRTYVWAPGDPTRSERAELLDLAQGLLPLLGGMLPGFPLAPAW